MTRAKQDAVRNFWIEAQIDTPSGAKQILAGGPAAKDGGFTLKIKMEGQTVLKITGSKHLGALRLCVEEERELNQWYCISKIEYEACMSLKGKQNG